MARMVKARRIFGKIMENLPVYNYAHDCTKTLSDSLRHDVCNVIRFKMKLAANSTDEKLSVVTFCLKAKGCYMEKNV
jgi:hypothetical protein